MPKKWKELLDEDLAKAKTTEEKADILITAHEEMVHLQNKHELGADEIHGAYTRKAAKEADK